MKIRYKANLFSLFVMYLDLEDQVDCDVSVNSARRVECLLNVCKRSKGSLDVQYKIWLQDLKEHIFD